MEIGTAAPYGKAPDKDHPSALLLQRADAEPVRWLRVGSYTLGVIPYEADEIYVYRNEQGNLGYLCVVSKFDSNGRETFVQKNVWQLNCPRGFARMVMRYLSSDGRILASDERQRAKGAIMWKSFLKENCNDRHVYLQTAVSISEILPHTREMMIAFAYAGNSDTKVFAVSDQPIKGRIRSKW
jgi:hypothetical protein